MCNTCDVAVKVYTCVLVVVPTKLYPEYTGMPVKAP